MKEQNKTPGKELNEMEIRNLSDAEIQNTGYQDAQRNHWVLQKHKKDPGRKVALSEIKKNPQGTNSGGDEAEIQINNLEHKEEKSISSE